MQTLGTKNFSMPRILLIKNIPREGAGLLEDVLLARKITFDIFEAGDGKPFPAAQAYDAVVVFGGPDSANDASEKMQSELIFIRRCLSLKKPYLGICLGMQALVKAAGGSVMESPLKEVGLRDPEGNLFSVQLTRAGRADPLFSGLPDELVVFQLHGETVGLGAEMQLLGTGKHCANQIVRVGPAAYGIQGHLEVDPPILEDWLAQDPDLKTLNAEKLRADFSENYRRFYSDGRRIFENFLGIAKII